MAVQLSSAHMITYHLVAQKQECTRVQMVSMADMSESVTPKTNRTIYSCVRCKSKGEVGTVAQLKISMNGVS